MMHLRSQSTSLTSTTALASSGGRSTCSTSRGRGTLPPHNQSGPIATPITPSRMTKVTTRTEPTALSVSAPMSPNKYALLGDDNTTPATATVEAPPDPNPMDTTHGWDSFIGGLDDTTKGAMGFIDPILINYANFVGDELRAFHLESAQMMTQLKKLDDDTATDHDVVVKVINPLNF